MDGASWYIEIWGVFDLFSPLWVGYTPGKIESEDPFGKCWGHTGVGDESDTGGKIQSG